MEDPKGNLPGESSRPHKLPEAIETLTTWLGWLSLYELQYVAPAERSLALHKSLIRLMIIMHLVCTLKFEDVEECLLPYYYTTTSFQSAMS